MTHNQYSTIQRCLGQLEGMAFTLPGTVSGSLFDVIETLDGVIDDVRKEDGHEGEC